MIKINDLANEVRMLELEEKKLELEKHITQLKAEQSIDEVCVGCAGPCSDRVKERLKVEEGEVARLRFIITREHGEAVKLQKELDATRGMYFAGQKYIAKQNQTLLHISAELDAIKQYDPFGETDRLHKIINDLKSKLSEKPDTIGMLNYTTNIEKVVLESPVHNDTIEELKDKNIEDLKELYDLYEGELFAAKAVRGSIISLGQEIIDNLEAELRGIKADRTSIKSDRDIMFQNYRNTVAKLQEDIRDLEAELSTRKDDSEVLMKVVHVVELWDTPPTDVDMRKVRVLVEDYLDAPEVPPETPIDEPQEITVAIAFLELP